MSTPSSNRFLIVAAYAKSTITKYTHAVSLFLTWAESHGFDPSTPSAFDDLLTDYFHHLFLTQQGKGVAHATLYGTLMFLPHLKGCLPLASMALRGWNKLTPPKAYPPLTWELTCAIAVRMASNGNMRAGIGCLLAFDCFLRVGELVGLRKEDVADAKDARIGAQSKDMIIRLAVTKTGKDQWVVVEDPTVKRLLRILVANTKHRAYIFPFSSNSFRHHFKLATSSLGLSNSYVPHSLRHGGATRAHLQNRTMEDILIRGRWASSKSARRYIQSGRAVLMTMNVPERLRDLSNRISSNLFIFFTLSQSH